MRQEYSQAGLRRNQLDPDPIVQFEMWLQEAIAADLDEPNAMVLSTVSAAGALTSRVVLLKGIVGGEFQFFTNYQSAKARDLAVDGNAALTFAWLGLQRQVNISGIATRVEAAVSDEYFSIRPRQSQLGAWASQQSEPLVDRAELEYSMEQASQRFGDAVPRPEFWGGYKLRPDRVEFWQGRPNRLHDRFSYTRALIEDEAQTPSWSVQRLNP